MENHFILRSVNENDIEDLYELSGKVTFINLPHDRDFITKQVKSSIKAFESGPSEDLSNDYYLFAIEDIESNKVIGASLIHAQHGTQREPHFFLSVGTEHRYSDTINTGFTHGTLKLGLETDGPTEIGGLVLSPDYRGNPNKLGKQISFVRFLYMGLNQDRFKQLIHSELMPPLDKQGKSPLWEAIGRRFMNMEYTEADILSRNNKEFILSLFPSQNIYTTLLPLEARDAIGKVGPDTLPVKMMLEKIGFKYTREVDPFDGGPHYRALLKDLKPIKELCQYKYNEELKKGETINALVSIPTNSTHFCAINSEVIVDRKKEQINLKNTKVFKKYLKELSNKDILSFIPF